MEPFIYTAHPARVLFGSGTLLKIDDEVSLLNATKPFILATPGQGPLISKIRSILHAGSIVGDIPCYGKATLHTPIEVTEDALRLANAHQTDCIISIGGGSVIGLGKALAVRTGWPHIAIPTTYSGSEMTSILGELIDGVKNTRSDPRILPKTVIYDVDLTLDLPPRLSATSGINAMAHAVEALYAENANPIIMLMAKEGIRALARSLPIIVQDPSAKDARSSALYGAWLCATTVGSPTIGPGLHHKLCHAIAGSFGLPHSATHTILLPHALAYNAPNVQQAMQSIAECLPNSDGDAIKGLTLLLTRLGVPRGLKDLGFKESDIDKATDIAVSKPYPNPREFDRDKIRELVRRAWAGEEPRADL